MHGRLLRPSRLVVVLVYVAAGLALTTGIVQAALGPGSASEPGAETAGVDERCVDPPCLPESLPPLEYLPLVMPVLVLAGAVLLGVLVLVGGLRGVLRDSGDLLATGLLLVAAPLLVLVGAETVPHVITPCWAGELGGLCAQTEEHGIDYADHLHQLGHAVLGWVPMAAGYWLLLKRRRPDLLPGRPGLLTRRG